MRSSTQVSKLIGMYEEFCESPAFSTSGPWTLELSLGTLTRNPDLELRNLFPLPGTVTWNFGTIRNLHLEPFLRTSWNLYAKPLLGTLEPPGSFTWHPSLEPGTLGTLTWAPYFEPWNLPEPSLGTLTWTLGISWILDTWNRNPYLGWLPQIAPGPNLAETTKLSAVGKNIAKKQEIHHVPKKMVKPWFSAPHFPFFDPFLSLPSGGPPLLSSARRLRRLETRSPWIPSRVLFRVLTKLQATPFCGVLAVWCFFSRSVPHY